MPASSNPPAAPTGATPAEPALAALLAGAAIAAGGPAGRVRELAGRALAGLGDDDGFYGVITGSAVMALVYADEVGLASRAIRAALDHARHAGSLIALGTATHWQAELCYRQGLLTEAIRCGEQTLDVCRAGFDMCRGWVVPLLVAAHLDRGDLGSAEDVLRLAGQAAAGRPERALAIAARGRLALARGDPAAALRDLHAAGDLVARHGLSQPALLPWRIWAVLPALQLGQRGHALELAHQALALARPVGTPRTLGAALRVTGLATGGDLGEGMLTESVAVLEHSPAALEHVRALVALGALRCRMGRHAAAREPLRQALDLAEGLGASVLAARARSELRAGGGRRRPARPGNGPGALTAAERRVAALAAQGQSAAQVAQQLYVSRKTVEWHLGHVYQKLAVHSRHELAQALERWQIALRDTTSLASRPGRSGVPAWRRGSNWSGSGLLVRPRLLRGEAGKTGGRGGTPRGGAHGRHSQDHQAGTLRGRAAGERDRGVGHGPAVRPPAADLETGRLAEVPCPVAPGQAGRPASVRSRTASGARARISAARPSSGRSPSPACPAPGRVRPG